MHTRINVTLPQETVRLLGRVAPRGDRSKFIDHVVRTTVQRQGLAKLRKELTEGYLRENAINRKLAEEWFFIDEEAWQKAEQK